MKLLSKFLVLALFFIGAQSVSAQSSHGKMMNDVTVINLSQIEGKYQQTSLELAPGKYVFEVTNRSVGKKLGFYLTNKNGEKKQIPNSGLVELVNKGETARTGVVELGAGTYEYSCPLNPTPHYSLKVSDK
jgi:hypothetical protein